MYSKAPPAEVRKELDTSIRVTQAPFQQETTRRGKVPCFKLCTT